MEQPSSIKCQQCGLVNVATDINCERCGTELHQPSSTLNSVVESKNDSIPVEVQDSAIQDETLPGHTFQKGHKSIGGWLILPAIGLILSPLNILSALFLDVKLLFSQRWNLLTNPSSSLYSYWWKPLVTYEILGNLLFLIYVVITTIFFFKQKRAAPRLVIIIIPLGFVFLYVDHLIGGQVPLIAASNVHSWMSIMLIGRYIALHLWIPYFLLSKRVKETFVN